MLLMMIDDACCLCSTCLCCYCCWLLLFVALFVGRQKDPKLAFTLFCYKLSSVVVGWFVCFLT